MTDNRLSQIYPKGDADTVIEAALSTIAESSKRSYARTYALWVEWCGVNHYHPLDDLSALRVRFFLQTRHTTVKTRNNYLSHLRKLAQTAALDPRDLRAQANWQSLGMLRAPTEHARRAKEKDQFLHPNAVNALVFAWATETNIGARNRAIISMLLATGVRRSECATLRWPDLDWDARTIGVRHGKGDKPRRCAIVDSFCITALRVWFERSHTHSRREWLFCPITNVGDVGRDKHISPETIYAVVKKTEQLTNIPFNPHMARHTHTTELLKNGAGMADVQAQLGHENPATTLGYSHPVSAEKRHETFRTRWRQSEKP